LKPRALARELRIPNDDYTTFRALVRQMLAEGTLALGPGRTLRLPEQTGLIVGAFRAHPRGFGFIQRPPHPDLYVPADRTRGALDGDTVGARLIRPRSRTSAVQAEIVRILERAPLRRVGVLEHRGPVWIVRPQGRDPLPPIRIDDPTAKSAQTGDLVVVDLLEHTLGTRDIRGAIVERLGDPNLARTQILGVIRRFAIPDHFPSAVPQAARQAAAHFDPDALDGREDLRTLLTVTIDPPDARDFDDAVSVENLPDGRQRLGVHIADVAHFVPLDGPVDLEARRRGTSAYFPGCVVPMLPEVLSNGVCSLQPGEPRLAKSVFLTYDRAGQVVDTRFADSVICSAARLTYPQVTAAFEGKPADIGPDVLALLRRAEGLARRIQCRRLHDGMIALTIPEVEITLDDRGRVAGAGPAETSFSHTIIEMFMVEANEAVSRRLTHEGLRHLRRVHPEPDAAAVETLTPLALLLGKRLPAALDRKGILKLLAAVAGRPEESVVSWVLLRALPQAFYSPSEEGHFALASRDYCHFTSPIRRYPDLSVHRLLELIVARQDGCHRQRRSGAVLSDAELVDLGRRTSSAERRALHAERAARQVLLLMLMKTKLGAILDGVITGLAPIGAFVRVMPYMAEGLIRLADFGADDWVYDARHGAVIGRKSRRVLTLGQSVRIQVVAVDEQRGDLVLRPADRHVIGAAADTGLGPGSATVDWHGRLPRTRRKKRGHQGP
jgi:ribonuclease R